MTLAATADHADGRAPGGVALTVIALTVILGGLTVIRLVMAAVTPLSPDEAYYWLWSRALQPGYLDHPPMVALWIRIGTILLGRTALGVRILAPLSALAGSALIWRAAEDLFPRRAAGPVAALILNATLVLGAGSVIMTPDTPLLFFWCLTLWAMARLLTSGRPVWWLIAGLAVGAAMDSKYTAALLPLSIVAWIIAVPSLRLWLRRWEPYGAALIALLAFSPVLFWNARHGWASFARQGGRLGDVHPARALRFLAELVAGQIGLATPAIAIACGLGVVWAARRWRRPETGLVAALVIVPGLVFVQHALGDRVQANWPCVIYPAACIAAAGRGVRWWRGAVALGLAVTGLVYLQAALWPFPLPPRADPSLTRLGGWAGWAAQIDQIRRDQGLAYIASEQYGDSALLAWHLPHTLVVGVAPRWRLFRMPRLTCTEASRTGLLVVESRAAPGRTLFWIQKTPDGAVARIRGGMIAGVSDLYRVRARCDAAGDWVRLN